MPQYSHRFPARPRTKSASADGTLMQVVFPADAGLLLAAVRLPRSTRQGTPVHLSLPAVTNPRCCDPLILANAGQPAAANADHRRNEPMLRERGWWYSRLQQSV